MDFGNAHQNAPQTEQEYFKSILVTVVGQAFTAAGYELEERPMQWAHGLFRFVKRFDDDTYGFIEFQLLAYVDTEWADHAPSRFNVTLTRSDKRNPRSATDWSGYARRDLGTLIVEDFGVAILPSGNHWWTYENINELGHTLGEAGHLIVGYGIPWLAGDLQPPSDGKQSE